MGYLLNLIYNLTPLPSNNVFLLALEKAFMGLFLHSFMKGYSRLLLSLILNICEILVYP